MLSHILIIEIFNWKIGKHSSISKLMTLIILWVSFQFYLSSDSCKMNVVFSPLFLPCQSLKTYRKGACHLNSFAYWKFWCSFMIKKSHSSILQINRSTCYLDRINTIIFFHCNSLHETPNFLVLFDSANYLRYLLKFCIYF